MNVSPTQQLHNSTDPNHQHWDGRLCIKTGQWENVRHSRRGRRQKPQTTHLTTRGKRTATRPAMSSLCVTFCLHPGYHIHFPQCRSTDFSEVSIPFSSQSPTERKTLKAEQYFTPPGPNSPHMLLTWHVRHDLGPQRTTTEDWSPQNSSQRRVLGQREWEMKNGFVTK